MSEQQNKEIKPQSTKKPATTETIENKGLGADNQIITRIRSVKAQADDIPSQVAMLKQLNSAQQQKVVQTLSATKGNGYIVQLMRAYTAADQATAGEEKPTLQTKLTVGKPGDKYEEEADSVAAKVMGKTVSSSPETAPQSPPTATEGEGGPPQLQTKPTTDPHSPSNVSLSPAISGKGSTPPTISHRPASPSVATKKTADKGGPTLQTKLMVNPPDDMYEQEANRTADLVMQTVATPTPPEDPGGNQGGVLTSPSAATKGEGGHPLLQAKSDGATPAGSNVEASIERMQSGGGQPLPTEERTFFKERMGMDFSNVQIHTDQNAIQTAQDLNAQAFTVGTNIAFNADKYAPGTTAGRTLLAHELTHVAQQGGAVQCKQKEPTTPPPNSSVPSESPYTIQRKVDPQTDRQLIPPSGDRGEAGGPPKSLANELKDALDKHGNQSKKANAVKEVAQQRGPTEGAEARKNNVELIQRLAKELPWSDFLEVEGYLGASLAGKLQAVLWWVKEKREAALDLADKAGEEDAQKVLEDAALMEWAAEALGKNDMLLLLSRFNTLLQAKLKAALSLWGGDIGNMLYLTTVDTPTMWAQALLRDIGFLLGLRKELLAKGLEETVVDEGLQDMIGGMKAPLEDKNLTAGAIWGYDLAVMANLSEGKNAENVAIEEIIKLASGSVAAYRVQEASSVDAPALAGKIHDAIKGIGTKSELLVEALGHRTPGQIALIRAAYQKIYSGRSLDVDVRKDLQSNAWQKWGEAALNSDEIGQDAARLRIILGGLWLDEKTVISVLQRYNKDRFDLLNSRYIDYFFGESLETLETALKNRMSSHSLEQLKALLAGDKRKADAIAWNQAIYKKDAAAIEQIYKRNRQEVEAENLGRGLTTAELEAKIQERNDEMLEAYQQSYGETEAKEQDTSAAPPAEYDKKPVSKTLNMAAYQIKSTENQTAENLAAGLAEHNPAAIDAARLQIATAKGDKKATQEVLRQQYERAKETIYRDAALKKQEAGLEEQVKQQAKKNMEELRKEFNQQYSEYWQQQAALANQQAGRIGSPMGGLIINLSQNSAGWGKDAFEQALNLGLPDYGLVGGAELTQALVEGNGWLSDAQKVELATKGVGTDEEALRQVFEGKSEAEIDEIRREFRRDFGEEESDGILEVFRQALESVLYLVANQSVSNYTHQPIQPVYTVPPQKPLLDKTVLKEVGGRDKFDLKLLLEGKPETKGEWLDLLERWKEFEQSGLGTKLFANEDREVMLGRFKAFEKAIEAYYDTLAANPRQAKLLKELENYMKSQKGYLETSIEQHRAAVDAVTDYVTMATAVVTSVGLIVAINALTGGTAMGPTLYALSAIAGSVASMGTKAALKGYGAYGMGDFGIDLASLPIDALMAYRLAGLSLKLLQNITSLKAMAQNDALGKRLLAQAIAGAIENTPQDFPGGVVRTLLQESTWESDKTFQVILQSIVIQVAMSGGLGGGLSSLQGVAAPKKTSTNKPVGVTSTTNQADVYQSEVTPADLSGYPEGTGTTASEADVYSVNQPPVTASEANVYNINQPPATTNQVSPPLVAPDGVKASTPEHKKYSEGPMTHVYSVRGGEKEGPPSQKEVLDDLEQQLDRRKSPKKSSKAKEPPKKSPGPQEGAGTLSNLEGPFTPDIARSVLNGYPDNQLSPSEASMFLVKLGFKMKEDVFELFLKKASSLTWNDISLLPSKIEGGKVYARYLDQLAEKVKPIKSTEQTLSLLKLTIKPGYWDVDKLIDFMEFKPDDIDQFIRRMEKEGGVRLGFEGIGDEEEVEMDRIELKRKITSTLSNFIPEGRIRPGQPEIKKPKAMSKRTSDEVYADLATKKTIDDNLFYTHITGIDTLSPEGLDKLLSLVSDRTLTFHTIHTLLLKVNSDLPPGTTATLLRKAKPDPDAVLIIWRKRGKSSGPGEEELLRQALDETLKLRPGYTGSEEGFEVHDFKKKEDKLNRDIFEWMKRDAAEGTPLTSYRQMEIELKLANYRRYPNPYKNIPKAPTLQELIGAKAIHPGKLYKFAIDAENNIRLREIEGPITNATIKNADAPDAHSFLVGGENTFGAGGIIFKMDKQGELGIEKIECESGHYATIYPDSRSPQGFSYNSKKFGSTFKGFLRVLLETKYGLKTNSDTEWHVWFDGPIEQPAKPDQPPPPPPVTSKTPPPSRQKREPYRITGGREDYRARQWVDDETKESFDTPSGGNGSYSGNGPSPIPPKNIKPVDKFSEVFSSPSSLSWQNITSQLQPLKKIPRDLLPELLKRLGPNNVSSSLAINLLKSVENPSMTEVLMVLDMNNMLVRPPNAAIDTFIQTIEGIGIKLDNVDRGIIKGSLWAITKLEPANPVEIKSWNSNQVSEFLKSNSPLSEEVISSLAARMKDIYFQIDPPQFGQLLRRVPSSSLTWYVISPLRSIVRGEKIPASLLPELMEKLGPVRNFYIVIDLLEFIENPSLTEIKLVFDKMIVRPYDEAIDGFVYLMKRVNVLKGSDEAEVKNYLLAKPRVSEGVSDILPLKDNLTELPPTITVKPIKSSASTIESPESKIRKLKNSLEWVDVEKVEMLHSEKSVGDDNSTPQGLANSIDKDGFDLEYTIEVIITVDGRIILLEGGHHRLVAIKELGYKRMPALIFQETNDMDEETKSLFNLVKMKANWYKKEVGNQTSTSTDSHADPIPFVGKVSEGGPLPKDQLSPSVIKDILSKSEKIDPKNFMMLVKKASSLPWEIIIEFSNKVDGKTSGLQSFLLFYNLAKKLELPKITEEQTFILLKFAENPQYDQVFPVFEKMEYQPDDIDQFIAKAGLPTSDKGKLEEFFEWKPRRTSPSPPN